jgi:signal transduction histidine kinase
VEDAEDIVFATSGDRLRLSIHDDGRGFDPRLLIRVTD